MTSLRIATVHGVELIAEGDDVVLARRNRDGSFEDGAVKVWRRLARPGTLVLDIGAYTGLYSMLAARNGARVIAFEPNPAARERMTANMARLDPGIRGRIALDARAVSRRSGEEVVIGLGERGPLNSAAAVDGDGPRIKARTVALDGLDLPRISVAKIDAEGHEPDVLAGARVVLRKHRPVLLMEALGRSALARQARALKGFGYADPVELGERMWAWQPKERARR